MLKAALKHRRYIQVCYLLCCRVNGHPRDSVHTYGIVSGLIYFGFGLGSLTGPIISGIITDALDYAWTQTVLSFACALMVSYQILLNTKSTRS